jgi:metal-responsive CopG/Arc/MetJ family transcriptional regulator
VKPIKEYSYPKVCVGLTETQLRWLNKTAKKLEVSRQDVIRDLIRKEIAKGEHK